jgi:CRISPR-associated endonuclease/helicase Cas3
MAELLAHSARHGCPTQPYDEHIRNVVRGALHRARAMLRYYSPADATKSPNRAELLAIIGDATSFHDFGKLDPGFQQTLRENKKSPNHVRHEDAGVAQLALYGALEAAGLVSAHHRGLVKYDYQPEQKRFGHPTSKRLNVECFRINECPPTIAATNTRRVAYLQNHELLLGVRRAEVESGLSRCSGLTRRLMLSCLVDADHTDTARHYKQDLRIEPPTVRWAERLAALDAYVAGLKKPANEELCDAELNRQVIRDELYATCRNADVTPRLRSCDAVVGTGKTTAVMAHLLQVANARKLRHIFVVLPYTNIIRQSVKVYRAALCLPGEDPKAVVAEHHHQADFKDMALRGLATSWRAPIIVTTAVQFFETLAANKTSKLRKLHELAGSAVFVDEAHAAMPSQLLPVCWNWITEWSNEWGGHIVFASGSLAEFWTLDEFCAITQGKDAGQRPTRAKPVVMPLSADLRTKARNAEQARICFDTCATPLTADELCNLVEAAPGPRLVIVNTVQSAAVLAFHMQQRQKQEVLHISTALAPIDRLKLVEKIKHWLQEKKDWTLVATSLVEAGMDFSFATGFRQRSSTASLIQTGGRVNRGADRGISHVWDFDFVDTTVFPDNKIALAASKHALGELFDAGMISASRPTDLVAVCLQALRMEFKTKQQNLALEAVQSENNMDYPDVAKKCQLIDSDTRTVLIDRAMADRLRLGHRMDRAEREALILNSVQMYPHKIENLGMESVIRGSDDLYVLPKDWRYDPECFGYMAEWLHQQSLRISNGYFM